MINVLTIICNEVWKTVQWPQSWTQYLRITLPNKGNLKQCNHYHTIISHPSKVLLRIILNRQTASRKDNCGRTGGFRGKQEHILKKKKKLLYKDESGLDWNNQGVENFLCLNSKSCL